jgi:hypothetical protein
VELEKASLRWKGALSPEGWLLKISAVDLMQQSFVENLSSLSSLLRSLPEPHDGRVLASHNCFVVQIHDRRGFKSRA